MNFIRRMYVLVLSLVLVLVSLWVLLSPQSVLTWVGSLSEVAVLLRVGAAAVVLLVLMGLAFLQIRPDPRAKINGLVMRASGAITEVNVESARDRIMKAVREVPDVLETEVRVKPIRGRAEVELDVTVLGYDANLPEKQKEINRALNQVIHKQLGLQMAGQPRVHIRYAGPSRESVPESLPSRPAVSEPAPVIPVVPPPPMITPVATRPPSPDSAEPDKSFGFFKRVSPEAPSPKLADDSAPEEESGGVFGFLRRSDHDSSVDSKKPEVPPDTDEADSEISPLSSTDIEAEIKAALPDDLDDDRPAPPLKPPMPHNEEAANKPPSSAG